VKWLNWGMTSIFIVLGKTTVGNSMFWLINVWP
jgi:hypothetical protein